jgi:hypothetical protein
VAPGRRVCLVLRHLLLPAFDTLIPVLPTETALIALGVATAGSADPRIALLVALAAAGVFFIGRLGGKVFGNTPWDGLLLGLGIALVVSAAAGAARRARPWRILAYARGCRPSTRASESGLGMERAA